jgi:hypothetical protein
MSLQLIKDTITNYVKRYEICDGYQDVLCASTESELIEASKDFAEWAYSIGLVNDNLINMFDPATLILNGVYNTGLQTVVNPNFNDIFVTGNSQLTLNLTGCNRLRIVLISNNASLTINASGNAFFKVLRVKNKGRLTLNLTDNSSCICDMSGDGEMNVNADSNAVLHCLLHDGMLLYYGGSGNSFAKIKMYHNSLVSISPGSTVDIKKNDNSAILYDGTRN